MIPVAVALLSAAVVLALLSAATACAVAFDERPRRRRATRA